MARPVLINSEDVGYNLPELLRLAADQHVRREANKASRLDSGSAAGEQDARAVAKLTLSARDNFLRMDGKRRILADNLVIAVVGKSAKLKLQHCMGLARTVLLPVYLVQGVNQEGTKGDAMKEL